MFYLLLPLQFLCITTNLNDPINLARSILLIFAVTIFALAKPEVLKAKNKFIYLLLILPGIFVISAIANKQNPVLALLGNYNRNFGILTLLAIGLLVLITANSKMKMNAFLNYGVWPITALALIYSYMQSFDVDPFVWAETDRTVLTLGNSDYAASFLAMLIAVPIYGLVAYQNKLIKASMIPLLWLINNAGLNSQAYQYRVIALISVIVFLVVYFWEKITSLPKLLTGGSVVGLLGFALYFVLSNKAELISRTSFEDRISQQKMGISMFLDHPFFGVGIDQMWRYIPMYLKPIDILKNGSDVVPDKTHNIFIDHLAHGGILAGLVFTVFIVFSVIIVFQLMRKTDKKENRPLIALLAGIWAAYVAQQFISTDEVMLMIMPFMAFGLMCKLYFSEEEPSSKSQKKLTGNNSNLLIRGVMSLLLLVISIVGGQAIYYDSQVKKILTREIMNGDIALSMIKSFPNPKTTEAIIVDAMSNLQNCPFAIAATDELLKIDNRSSQAWYIKTLCVDATGDRKTALTFIENAIEFQPINTRYLEAKFKLMASLGDIVGATSVLETMKTINPNLPNLADLQALLKVPATN
jgi:O-antigen ligase